MANTINCFHVKIENWKSKQDRRKLHGCSTRFMKDCEKTDFENISSFPFPGTHTSAPVKKVAMRRTWPSCCLAWLASSPSATCPGWLFGCLVVWLFGCLVVCLLVGWLVDVLSIYLVLRVILIVGELFIVENRIKCGRFSRLICRVLRIFLLEGFSRLRPSSSAWPAPTTCCWGSTPPSTSSSTAAAPPGQSHILILLGPKKNNF